LDVIGEVLLLRFTSVCALLDLLKARLDIGANFLQLLSKPRVHDTRLFTLCVAPCQQATDASLNSTHSSGELQHRCGICPLCRCSFAAMTSCATRATALCVYDAHHSIRLLLRLSSPSVQPLGEHR
jgi:hypothetical protein